jgi:beta-mannosidase
MDLGGSWRVAESNEELRRRLADAELDDSAWSIQDVPGHWRSVPGFEGGDGPFLYRRRFQAPPGPDGSRAFVVFDGIFYQGDVWLDGEYLGDTEGYFFPHSFEVTEALARRDDHLLAVEVACHRPSDRKAKRNLTGVFQHWDCIDPDWNPGGIWAGVRLVRTGTVHIVSLKLLCRDANPERAVLELEAVLDRPTPGSVTVETVLRRENTAEPATTDTQTQNLSAGQNTVRWRVTVERPDLWWPRALGGQPLYEVSVRVYDGPPGPPSDQRTLLTGLRQIRVRNFIATVNGERLFLKGANLGPTRRDLAAATAEELARDVTLAAGAGLDLIRVHAHISRPELYQAADRAGMLLWQDMPLQWGYANVRRQAVSQARQAVNLLGHHPSIAIWCGHNEPMAVDLEPGTVVAPGTVARVVAAQVLPTWNKTGLDRSIRRALERADNSRPVVAHSGVVPHPMWGTDTHFYFGWYHGIERDFPGLLARLPVLARFVSEFGAQAVPETDGFMAPEAWPHLGWDHLGRHHCLQKDIFDDRVPPAAYHTFEEWKRATQHYQANLLRHHIETLRRLKYRPTGGFCLFMLADSQPGVTWSILDHERVPKSAYQVVADACRPVIVVADRPEPAYRPGDRIALDIHAVSDLRTAVRGAVIDAVLQWPGGRRAWRFAGDLDADRCIRIGRIEAEFPRKCSQGPVEVELRMRWADGEVANRYSSHIEI